MKILKGDLIKRPGPAEREKVQNNSSPPIAPHWGYSASEVLLFNYLVSRSDYLRKYMVDIFICGFTKVLAKILTNILTKTSISEL